MKVLRWLAALFVLWLVWAALSKSENYMPPGSYDSQFFFEQDSQIRENPWVGILQEKVRDAEEKYTIQGCVYPDVKCLFKKNFQETELQEKTILDKGRIGTFKPAEDMSNIPMYMIT